MPEHELEPPPPPDSVDVDRWLTSGNWRALPKIGTVVVVALALLLTLGCSSPQVVKAGPCAWRTSVLVAGPGGKPQLTAEGQCRGRLWGLPPIGGTLRCTASIDLPGTATETQE